MSKELEDKLRSMKVSNLKKEISKTNVRGYSKLKKEEVIKFMLANKKRFMYLINKEKQFITKGGKTFPVGKKEAKKEESKKPEPKKSEPKSTKKEDNEAKDFIKLVKDFNKNPNMDKLKKINDMVKKSNKDDLFSVLSKPTYTKFLTIGVPEPKSTKEEPKKPEPKKEEISTNVAKELSKLDKLKDDLKKFQSTLDKLAQPRSAKTADIAEKLIDMRQKLSSKIANIKFDIFEEQGKQKDRDEKDRIKKEKKELADFKKAVNDFIKKPTEELLEEIDNKFELTDDIPDSLLKKLEKAIDKFNKS